MKHFGPPPGVPHSHAKYVVSMCASCDCHGDHVISLQAIREEQPEGKAFRNTKEQEVLTFELRTVVFRMVAMMVSVQLNSLLFTFHVRWQLERGWG